MFAVPNASCIDCKRLYSKCNCTQEHDAELYHRALTGRGEPITSTEVIALLDTLREWARDYKMQEAALEKLQTKLSKSNLTTALDSLREQINDMSPDDCCEKQIMRESNGKETRYCIESCQWLKLEKLLADATIEAELLVNK